MRHHDKQKVLGREMNARGALMASLARELILNEAIQTTEAKAKAVRPFVEKLVTRAKEDTVGNRRLVASMFHNEQRVVRALFENVAPRYKERAGGYTRIIKMGAQGADARKVAHISFV